MSCLMRCRHLASLLSSPVRCHRSRRNRLCERSRFHLPFLHAHRAAVSFPSTSSVRPSRLHLMARGDGNRGCGNRGCTTGGCYSARHRRRVKTAEFCATAFIYLVTRASGRRPEGYKKGPQLYRSSRPTTTPIPSVARGRDTPPPAVGNAPNTCKWQDIIYPEKKMERRHLVDAAEKKHQHTKYSPTDPPEPANTVLTNLERAFTSKIVQQAQTQNR